YGAVAPVSILSNAKDLSFENLTIRSKPRDGVYPCIFYVGPESMAFGWTEANSEAERKTPVEVFMSDYSCTVENIELKNIRDAEGNPYPEPEKLVKEVQLSLNPNYLHTKPRGGTGFGVVKKVEVK
ncbi:MAG: hypothetical protein ACI4UF_05575, partial [Thermoguttaceae bacterium]